MDQPRDHRDKGLARERTILAWYRIGLAAVVCAAVLLRRAWPLRHTGEIVVLGVIAGAAILWGIGLLAIAHSDAYRGPARPRDIRLISLGTLMFAAAAFVVALSPSP